MKPTKLQGVAILGSTGSVGANTLDVVARHPGRFRVVALTAQSNSAALLEQVRQHRPPYAVLTDPAAAEALAAGIREEGIATEVLAGIQALERVAALPEVDTVMAAIVGIAGLKPAMAAARAGKKVLLANKEALVTAGSVFMQAVREGGATLLPIDSEHNAIFQSLPAAFRGDLGAVGARRVLLTASGGPFRNTPAAELEHVTPDAACAHPNWVMGRKISVDSATMMNKGLEVIEARWLFDAHPSQIEVVIHPESIVHSLVEYDDGSVIAQLGNPDMRTPIAHALAFPDRIDAGVKFLDLARVGTLHFEAPDLARFPCLKLAYRALEAGGCAPALLNAANEVAVAAFLDRQIGFTDIPRVIERVLDRCAVSGVATLGDVLEADREGRACAESWIRRQQPGRVSRAAVHVTGAHQ